MSVTRANELKYGNPPMRKTDTAHDGRRVGILAQEYADRIEHELSSQA